MKKNDATLEIVVAEFHRTSCIDRDWHSVTATYKHLAGQNGHSSQVTGKLAAMDKQESPDQEPQLRSSPLSCFLHNQLLRVPSAGDFGEITGLGAYELQVGGHAEFVKPSSNSRVVLKPYDSYEFAFYSRLVSDPVAARLLPFTACCYGAVSSQVSLVPKFVMLEDLAHGLRRPCIVDLKMGLRQRSIRDASWDKISRARVKAASTTSHVFGFRLCGMAFWESPDRRNFQDKYEGRSLDASGVYSTFKRFFRQGQGGNLVRNFVDQLRVLSTVISQLPAMRFWSGSLLLVYDADNTEIATLKMIDFAQTAILANEAAPDREYLFGVRNLIRFLEALDRNDPLPPAVADPAPNPAEQDAELFNILGIAIHDSLTP